MTANQKADLEFYAAEARTHLFEGRLTQALGCYILGRDLAGLKVHDQTRRDYLARLHEESRAKMKASHKS